jgi:hypothetical protein
MDPEFFDISEALVICKIVYEKDAMCAFVVGTGDGPKSLLPSSIPDLQLNNAIIDIKRPTSQKIYLNLKSTPIVAR